MAGSGDRVFEDRHSYYAGCVPRVSARSSLLALIVFLASAQAQTQLATKWEAVSIKQCPSGSGGRGGQSGGLRVSAGRLRAICLPVAFLISNAYVVYADDIQKPAESVPISGAPGWLNSDAYDVDAKAEGDPAASAMEGPMLQGLLEDRFRLKIRRQTKEILVYDLNVARNGIKIQPLAKDACTRAQHCGLTRYGRARDGMPAFVEYHGMSFDQISANLIQVLDRPVVNKTGIPGLFHFHVDFAPDGVIPKFAPAVPDDAPLGASFFTALEQQLGLKLEPAVGPGESLVIEHVERPSGN